MWLSARRRQGFLHRPPVRETPIECGFGNATAVCPHPEGLGDPSPHDQLGTSGVLRLLPIGGPVTIILAVGAVVVPAFQGRMRWTISHVVEEFQEVLTPRLGHVDAALPVVLVTGVFRIVAARFGATPDAVQRMLLRSVACVPVLLWAADRVTMEASAALALSFDEQITGSLAGIAAAAYTFPECLAVWGSTNPAFGRESSKCLPC